MKKMDELMIWLSEMIFKSGGVTDWVVRAGLVMGLIYVLMILIAVLVR